MNNPFIISISGKAGSGKDTVAKMITEELSHIGMHPPLAFATALKLQLKHLGWDGKKDQKGRTFLQEIADATKKYHGEDYYANIIAKKIELASKSQHTPIFIVTDTRYKYELEALKKVGHVVSIYIDREFESDLSKTQASHSSENGISKEDIDYVTDNSDLEELRYNVKLFLDVIGLKDWEEN